MVVPQTLLRVPPFGVLGVVYINSRFFEVVLKFHRHSVVSLAVLRVLTRAHNQIVPQIGLSVRAIRCLLRLIDLFTFLEPNLLLAIRFAACFAAADEAARTTIGMARRTPATTTGTNQTGSAITGILSTCVLDELDELDELVAFDRKRRFDIGTRGTHRPG